MITFEPLWKTMKRKNVTIYALIEHHKISRSTISRMKHNRNVTLNTVAMMCDILDCEIQDVIRYIPRIKSENESKE